MLVEAISVAAILHVSSMSPTKDVGSKNDLYCLSANIYHEARGEPIAGQMAVGIVTRNRVYDDKTRWPGSYCDVVYQRRQFSWTQQLPKLRKSPHEEVAWVKAVVVAAAVMNGIVEDFTYGATYFCNKAEAKSTWCNKAKTSVVIGQHTFMVDLKDVVPKKPILAKMDEIIPKRQNKPFQQTASR